MPCFIKSQVQSVIAYCRLICVITHTEKLKSQTYNKVNDYCLSSPIPQTRFIMSLPSLPDRLLKHILSYIHDFADYFHIRITCKKLYKASRIYPTITTNKPQCYLYGALITLVQRKDSIIDLSGKRYELLESFMDISLSKSNPYCYFVKHYRHTLFYRLLDNYGESKLDVTLIEFVWLMGHLSEHQARDIGQLVKSMMLKSTITSLKLSHCGFNNDTLTKFIRFMKQQDLHLKLQHLDLDCNRLTSFICIHQIQEVFDECELTIKNNKMRKNKCRIPIKGVVRVHLADNWIDKITVMPRFKDANGYMLENVITYD